MAENNGEAKEIHEREGFKKFLDDAYGYMPEDIEKKNKFMDMLADLLKKRKQSGFPKLSAKVV